MRSKNKSKNELVNKILETYQPETAKDVQDALKDVFGSLFEAMLQGEMNSHLVYENNSKEQNEFEKFKSNWSKYTGTADV